MGNRDVQFHLRMTPEEHEIIASKAKEAGMQFAPYIRKAAMNPKINVIDYSVIAAHTAEVAEVRKAINRLVFTIDAQNNYLPREIETVVDLMNEIFESENKLLRTVRSHRKK